MARTYNYMPARQKKLIIATVLTVLAAGGLIAWAINQPTPTPPPASSTPPPPPPTPTPASPPAPTPAPAGVDLSDPQQVAIAWARAYYDRATGTDQSYLAKIDPYIDPSLREYMRTDEFNIDKQGFFDQSEGTRVLDVKITPQDGTGGRDTPDRWTRTVTVTVQGRTTGRTVDIPYTLSLLADGKEWFIASAPKKIRVQD